MLFMSSAFLALAIFGHLLLTRASLGFSYTLGIRKSGWHWLVAAHAFVGVAVSIWMLMRAGGRALHAIPYPWLVYMSVCIAAVVVGAVVLFLRHLNSIPRVLRSNHTTTRDAIDELGRVPAAPSLAGRLARIPGNENFRVDFRTVEVTIPRLPQSLDGLSILHLTDLHFIGTPDRSFFEWAATCCDEMKPDIATITGDIADRVECLDWLPTTLAKINAPLGRFFVLGNHDLDCAPDQIRSAMESIGWTHVGSCTRSIKHNGATILLAGSELPWAGEHPGIEDDARTASSLRILLAHLPQEIWWARRHHFDLALAGHLHGGQIRFPIFGPIIGGRLASGLFHLEPTVLHVGRGLGALAPLRFGCPPDVVKLLLRCPSAT